MNIKDMFFKEIDRDIKGVIKVGQADDENVFQELDEYVVTSELEKYMNRFFTAYKEGVESRTDKMGVWISGFFGSGKSHFLKILSYLLSDKAVLDEKQQQRTASSFFLDGVKVENDSLRKKIEEVSGWSKEVDVILFNIDSKSATDSKMNKEAIKDVFMKVFNDYLGYCGSIPFLADFERKLDSDGKYNAFKTKFEEINGMPWTEAREDFYFIQEEIIEAAVSLDIMSENEARNWIENAQNSYSLSIDQFAEYVRKYCAGKGKNHHVLFLVDEIGQYIADDSRLMLNLQTVTEDLGTACRGNAWIIVTSQQDIDSITRTMGEDFSKIQGRFDTRIALSSANVDEVIRRRILHKTDLAAAILRDMYERYEFDIKGNITFSEGTPEMPLYADAGEFAEVYPFIPYQFKLLGNVLTSVRQYSSSGKHLADGERSMLALFKEAAQKVEYEREGILVPFNAFYSALDDFIDHTHRIVITQAARNTRLKDFDVELLKVLFMIKHVNNFSRNLENITTLMISGMNEDRLALGKKVEASLRALCDEMLVQRNGNEYIFLTNEEQEAENAIRAINIDPTETVNYVAQVAFEEIIVMPNNKFRYSNRYQFSFNQKIDDRPYKNNQSSNINLHLLTAYSGEVDDLALSLRAAKEKSVIVRLSDEYPYLSETEEMKRIESFLQRPDLTSLTDYEIISANKRRERNEKAKRIKDYVRMALEAADIYVCNGRLRSKSKEVIARVNEAFEKLIASEYSKLKDMETEPAQADILELLKRNTTQLTLDFGDAGEANAEALKEMEAAVQYAGRTGARFSIKQAFDKFMNAPYGYVEEDVEFLIASLYKKGKISLKMNSVIYSPASTGAEDAYKYITRREYREKILLERKEMPKPQWVKAVKDVIRDFFCRSVVTEDTDVLMRDFRGFGSYKKAEIEEVLRRDYGRESKLPGKAVLEKAVRLIDDTCGINDPMSFYRRVDELYDDFDETAIELGDLNAFLAGVQKEKFIRACRTLAFFDASKNYIADMEIIENANQIRKIINLQKPYGLIPRLEQYAKLLGNAIMARLEEDAGKIEPEIYADRKLVMDSVEEDRPYADRLKKKFAEKFDELTEKLYTCRDMASLNGIPSESNALLQNSLAEIDREEKNYQQSIRLRADAEAGEGQPNMPAEGRKVVRTLPVTMRSLTGNRTYTFRTESEVDHFVEEIRENLKAKLGDNIVIKLS